MGVDAGDGTLLNIKRGKMEDQKNLAVSAFAKECLEGYMEHKKMLNPPSSEQKTVAEKVKTFPKI